MAAINNICLCLVLLLSACANSDNKAVVDTDGSTKISTPERDLLPNDRFRRELSPHVRGKDSLTLDTVLSVLDKKGLTFCVYIQRLMELDDSCFAVSKRKFPDPSQQKELSNYITNAVERAEIGYSRSLGMSKHSMDFAETVYAFDTTARRICGNFPSYESNY